MKIAVMGSGGVGAYYGGLLAHHGHEVTFIARGAHLEAIQTTGLHVKSIHGDFVVLPAKVTEKPSQVGLVDFVLFCVKNPDTDSAAQAIQPVVGPGTTVMSLQNGIDAAERIGAVVGIEHMIGSTTWISSSIESPGVIRQVSQFRRIVLGELGGQMTSRVKTITEAFERTGITVESTENILKVLWTKFVFIAAISGVGSLTRLEIGEYRSIPETRAILISLMREIETVARAISVSLDTDVVEQSLTFIDNSAPHIKPSMQRDIETGRVSELEAIIGVIGRKGRELGLPTPVSDIVYAALLPIDLKARRADSA